jgi:hypothetical protein
MSLVLLIPGVGMGAGGVPVEFRGTLGTAGYDFMEIFPDTVIFPDDVIFPDGILGGRGSRRAPGSGTRATTASAGAGTRGTSSSAGASTRGSAAAAGVGSGRG